MKYIKNGIIFEPHNAFVEAQMKKAGYIPYEKVIEVEAEKEEAKEEAVEETKEEIVKVTKETKKKKK